jgi:hypothetical protein
MKTANVFVTEVICPKCNQEIPVNVDPQWPIELGDKTQCTNCGEVFIVESD